ncbi:MAG: DNA mismatch repair endonuclease MutL [Cyclobacteriaceae bacterium]
MPDIIKLLPDSIANQIAAGEVVQRPASVVKELLENSIDAGSTQISLVVKDAGKSLIQVIDNGKGMSEVDARMCFERHATSKITTSEDLFKIKTMGFRGEALASVAAVARVELKSKTAERELGTFIHIEASELKTQEATSVPDGTCVSVKNLFYNVPARRNFLKSNPVEMRHIIDEFQRASLAQPEIAFSLHHNDEEIYNFPAGKLSKRIVSLFGKNYGQQLIACQEETDLIKIHGYVGKPENSKKTRGEQFFFINGRFIKNNYLNHAVVGAYEGLLKEGHYPFYGLFIETDPIHIDINVHPTKTEVKFDDERSIYGIVKSAVKQALGTHNVTPSLDFSADVNFESLAVSKLNFDKPTRQDSNYGSFKSLEQKRTHAVNWEQLYESAMNESVPNIEQVQQEISGRSEQQLTFESKANKDIADKQDLSDDSSAAILLHGQYIVKQVKSGMLILDAKLAYERILYEKFENHVQGNKSISSQRCLFPQEVELNPADYTLVMQLREEIEALGFDFEVFGKSSIVINGIPSDIPSSNEKELFEGLIEQYKINNEKLSLDKKENMVRALAKRSANKTIVKNDKMELGTLIDRLFACQQPNYTADGTPTFVILGLEKIAEFFNK